jgi:hypothetical protein
MPDEIRSGKQIGPAHRGGDDRRRPIVISGEPGALRVSW